LSAPIDDAGCFPTGRHYPGIAHLLRVGAEGLASEWDESMALTRIPWVCLDTETTGRDAAVDRVIEVGAVVIEAGQVVSRQSWLIDPGCPIPAEASAVHGISDDDVRGAPPFEQVAGELLTVLEGRLPLAYNAEFDRGFLFAEFARAAVDGQAAPALRDEVTWLDPLDWARELLKDQKSRALGEVCARLGITLEQAHRASADAEAAGQVLVAFTKDERVPTAYGAFVREQRRLAQRFALERSRWRR
jgi:DNA polymerase-3 subunit epsilon